MLTVRELMAKLNEMPPDALVALAHYDPDRGETADPLEAVQSMTDMQVAKRFGFVFDDPAPTCLLLTYTPK